MGAFYPSARAHGKYPNSYTPDTMSRSLDVVYVNGISITITSACCSILLFHQNSDWKDYWMYNKNYRASYNIFA